VPPPSESSPPEPEPLESSSSEPPEPELLASSSSEPPEPEPLESSSSEPPEPELPGPSSSVPSRSSFGVVFDDAATDPTLGLWGVIGAAAAIDVSAAEGTDVVRGGDALGVVDELAELGADVATTAVAARSTERGAKRSRAGLSDTPLGASGEMYSGDGVVLNEFAAMTPAVPVAPSRPAASSHGP
jgi:hypothetical protein